MNSDYDYNSEYGYGRNQDQTPDSASRQPDSGAYRMRGDQIPGGSTTEPTGNPNPNANTNPYGYQNTGYSGGYTGYNGYNTQSYGGADNVYRANPMSGYNVKPAGTQPEKKKSSVGKGVIAAALVCALIGGIGGGAAVGMGLRSSTVSEQATAVEESVQEAPASEDSGSGGSAVESAPTNINTTVIDVTTNSETTSMTPQDVYEQYVNAVVAISNEGTTTNVFGQVSETASSGSGFIISQDGYIVTNNHVVAGAQKLTVTMTSGEEYEAEIIGADAENDVALIKIDATDLPTVSIGSSETIEVGQQVCAIGNPLGELTNTLTVGYVSALDREINENGTPINMFQTDCAINAGNSGGPIFDMHGNVVGITTAKYSSSSSYEASIEGIGFCVPIDDAMDIVSDLLEYGYVKGRPALGIACQAISSTVTQYYHLPSGVYVYSVEEGSAADKGGLQEGDIITAVDGDEVGSITEFKAKLKDYTAGDTALLSVYRSSESGAETLELTVTFDEKQ